MSVRDIPESNFTVDPIDNKLDMFWRTFKCCCDVVGGQDEGVRPGLACCPPLLLAFGVPQHAERVVFVGANYKYLMTHATPYTKIGTCRSLLRSLGYIYIDHKVWRLGGHESPRISTC